MAYHLDFTENAKADIAALKKAGNQAVLKKLFALLEELEEHPFVGTGKPEPLKHNLAGLFYRPKRKSHRPASPNYTAR